MVTTGRRAVPRRALALFDDQLGGCDQQRGWGLVTAFLGVRRVVGMDPKPGKVTCVSTNKYV
jgi:hypothetical protein